MMPGPDLVLAADLGPEVLTGSTRLTAGLATELVLNIVTTLAMVRRGKLISNLMVHVRPTNEKLRTRAVRIVRELAGTDEPAAMRALRETGWAIRKAQRRLISG